MVKRIITTGETDALLERMVAESRQKTAEEVPVVYLGQLEGDLGMVIVEAPTGVKYKNQVGGIALWHPEVEGYGIPCRVPREALDIVFVEKLGRGGMFGCGMPEKLADILDAIITKVAICKVATSRYDYLDDEEIRIDRERLQKADEAWLPVLLVSSCARGWLTWENSD